LKRTDGSGREIVDWFGEEKRTRFSVLTLGDVAESTPGQSRRLHPPDWHVPPLSERTPSTG
jgi:hypothetical protein